MRVPPYISVARYIKEAGGTRRKRLRDMRRAATTGEQAARPEEDEASGVTSSEDDSGQDVDDAIWTHPTGPTVPGGGLQVGGGPTEEEE